MRARLAIASAGVECEIREILLRDKAPELLLASPKGTVPVIVSDNIVIEESLDIMHWALSQTDPEYLLDMPAEGTNWIARCDGEFKAALDRYKYHNNLSDRATASEFLIDLDKQLANQAYLFGPTPKLADVAILTFIRQFSNVDKNWFDQQPWPHLARWLDRFVRSNRFQNIMHKYPVWQLGDVPTYFGQPKPNQ